MGGEDSWAGWIQPELVSMSTLSSLIGQSPDHFQPLRVGQRRVHGIIFDTAWCERFFALSADRNRILHTPKSQGGRGLIQGVALVSVMGSVASYAVHDSGPEDLPIRIVYPVHLDQTVFAGVELLSQDIRKKRFRSLVRLTLTHGGGTTVRNVIDPVEVILHGMVSL